MRLIYTLLCLSLVFIISSCSYDREDESVDTSLELVNLSFQINNPDPASGSRFFADEVDSIMLSLTDQSDNVIFTQKKYNAYSFGSGYLTDPITLKVGNYKITEFLVLDSSGDIIYATPIVGSGNESLVSNPLPIDFTVSKDAVEKVNISVVTTDGANASEFGYNSFNFSIEETLGLSVAAIEINAVDTTSSIVTGGNIVVKNESDVELYNGVLNNPTSLIRLNKGATQYKITITGSNYPTYNRTFTNAEMVAQQDSGLVITYYVAKLTSKPAEDGKDAVITDAPGFMAVPNSVRFLASSNTASGVPHKTRSLIDFEKLKDINENALIRSSTLNLFNDGVAHDNSTHTNEAWLSRVTETWDEDVIFANQPATTTVNRLDIASITGSVNINIDITALTSDYVSNPSTSFGFILQLQNETPQAAMSFASGDNPDESIRPSIEVVYATVQ